MHFLLLSYVLIIYASFSEAQSFGVTLRPPLIRLTTSASNAGASSDSNVCRTPAKPKNMKFDMNKYLGVWYMYARNPFAYEPLSRCVRWNYMQDQVLDYAIEATQVPPQKKYLSLTKVGITNVSNAPSFSIHNNDKLTMLEVPIVTWVLDTDYNNYAVRLSCFDVYKYVTFHSWIIETRKPIPDAKYITIANEVIKNAGMNPDHLLKIQQNNCPKPEEAVSEPTTEIVDDYTRKVYTVGNNPLFPKTTRRRFYNNWAK
ncbi:apolipoprotein D-like [Scaptodrosophila lebanonensis]|uniref:Apolipoprotein D-like n=1 Tax=Drosophila lebanonensis TaxID=7225 RepID=A0A6J2TE37_DROLE|nr:apolipoprotein D-like [Scaptodrosophila lebanonensis]